MTIKRQEFGVIERKLELTPKQGDHRFVYFYYGDKWVTRTKRLEQRGDLPCSDLIRQQLKLSETQLRNLLRCSFGKDDYIQHLRDRGLLPD